MDARKIVTTYLLAQAFGTTAWWCALFVAPESIYWFHPAGWPDGALLGLWLADGLLIVGGSLATAFLIRKRFPHAGIAIWMLAATTWYPTLYCIGVSALTGEAWVASGLMCCMAGMTLSMATIHGADHQSPALFRASAMIQTTAVAWTFTQLVIFWGVFLWVLPMAFREMEGHLGFAQFTHFFQKQLSMTAFTVASSLGLWSAWSMATSGGGTPLPTATAAKLVIVGPYRWIRNPMAVAGILQGLAIGWLLGSPAVIAYACTGIPVWHCMVRPSEEADLLMRFGHDYEHYRKSVRLWIPRTVKSKFQSIRY
jgi:protein-S-isoprenylcysteine O-methyltransferase Ste14